MSPNKAIRILLFLTFFLFIALFATYRIRLEYNSMALDDLRRQAEMEKRISEVDDILGLSDKNKNLKEEGDKLIQEDLKKYNTVRPETVQKITEMSNREIRIKNGLPVD